VNFLDMKIGELQLLAKEKGIKSVTKYRKQELIALLQQKSTEEKPVAPVRAKKVQTESVAEEKAMPAKDKSEAESVKEKKYTPIQQVVKEENKQQWGSNTSYKGELQRRNRLIYGEYLKGTAVCELAEDYFLSVKSIQRIIRQEKMRKVS